MTKEIRSSLECVIFAHFLKPKDSPLHKLSPKITFLCKEIIVCPFANFPKEKENFTVEEEQDIAGFFILRGISFAKSLNLLIFMLPSYLFPALLCHFVASLKGHKTKNNF